MSAPKPLETVELIMTLKAYNLLLEEFPMAKKYLSEQGNGYFLKIPIADYHGIGRFVLGLPGDIKVKTTKGFRKFLKEKKNNYSW